MSYQTQRQKVFEFINRNIIPAVRQHDVDYNQVVDLISTECYVSRSMAQSCLDSIISVGHIKRASFFNPNTNKEELTNVLTIPDEEVVNWISDIKEKEEKRKKEIEEADKLIKETEKKVKNGK